MLKTLIKQESSEQQISPHSNHKSIFSREGIETLYSLYGQLLYICIYPLNL